MKLNEELEEENNLWFTNIEHYLENVTNYFINLISIGIKYHFNPKIF